MRKPKIKPVSLQKLSADRRTCPKRFFMWFNQKWWLCELFVNQVTGTSERSYFRAPVDDMRKHLCIPAA